MANISCNSGLPINQVEDDDKEDCELSVELARLLKHEKKEIQPHQEPIEVVKLGIEEATKEVKIGASLEKHVHTELVKLLYEYVHVFALLYQHMPCLDTNIVEHHFHSSLNVLLLSKISKGLDQTWH